MTPFKTHAFPTQLAFQEIYSGAKKLCTILQVYYYLMVRIKQVENGMFAVLVSMSFS